MSPYSKEKQQPSYSYVGSKFTSECEYVQHGCTKSTNKCTAHKKSLLHSMAVATFK